MLDQIWICQNYIVALNLIFILHFLSPARLDFNLSKLYRGFKSHIFVWVCTFCRTLDRRPDSRRARVHPGSGEMGPGRSQPHAGGAHQQEEETRNGTPTLSSQQEGTISIFHKPRIQESTVSKTPLFCHGGAWFEQKAINIHELSHYP